MLGVLDAVAVWCPAFRRSGKAAPYFRVNAGHQVSASASIKLSPLEAEREQFPARHSLRIRVQHRIVHARVGQRRDGVDQLQRVLAFSEMYENAVDGMVVKSDFVRLFRPRVNQAWI